MSIYHVIVVTLVVWWSVAMVAGIGAIITVRQNARFRREYRARWGESESPADYLSPEETNHET